MCVSLKEYKVGVYKIKQSQISQDSLKIMATNLQASRVLKFLDTLVNEVVLWSIHRVFVNYSEQPPLSENPPREASRNGDLKEVYRQDERWKTRCRDKGEDRRREKMQFYQKYSEGLLLVGKRQKMKDIWDWPSHSTASLPGYGFILLFRFYSVRL